MEQTVEEDTYTTIAIKREGGETLFSLQLTAQGPRSCGGRLLIELGNGERVELRDPLRFFDEVWTHGRLEGLAEKAAE